MTAIIQGYTYGRRLRSLGLLALSALVCGLPAHAARRGILDQIDLPHPYYYHELYLPQITNGPSSLAWAPDSRELVYSMGGTLWRQRTESTQAVQLTDGDGADFQPDWSPDGRQIVYASYRHGAIELWLLDVASGHSTQLTRSGAVSVEPRFSPDGRRIAFVSTQGTGHFHLFVAELSGDTLARVTALTQDRRSPLPRYYYSAFDHEINPAWTRDGRELVFVSNRGHVHGTGGLWRMAARPGTPAREIHYEETNWRTRPDVSPDGTTLVYSSYLGRNTHQLWLMPAAGGDPFALTYGDYDAGGARWSPDGHHIAYVTNEGGDYDLRILDFPGHDARVLPATVRRTLRPTGTLALRIVDEAGRPIAARVSVTDARGRPYAPADAWLQGDDSYDRATAAGELHYFHTAGEATLEVPAEPLQVRISHGLETPPEERVVTASAGATAALTVTLHPAPFSTELAPHWLSGDAHVHMNYAGSYRNTPARLANQARAEDLGVVNALVVNKEQRFPDIAWAGPAGNVAAADVAVVHGQEFHTSYWGHLGVLHPGGGPILPGYVGYPNTAVASLSPTNADVADLAHAQGALVGYVHPFDDLPDPVARPVERLTNELPVDVALGKVDYIEVLGFSDHRSTAAIWYRLLNLGFRLPAAAGTDAMADYASLRGPVGLNRVYVAVPGAGVDTDAWLAGLRAGRTFATNGPLLEFALDGAGPGGERTYRQAAAVPYRARLRSIVPVDRLQVVCNGRVVADLLGGRAAASGEFQGTLPVERTGWCLLRADADTAAYPVLDNYTYATTSPVYVTVGDAPARATEDAKFFVAWIDRVLATTAAHPGFRSSGERESVLAMLRRAQAVYRDLE